MSRLASNFVLLALPVLIVVAALTLKRFPLLAVIVALGPAVMLLLGFVLAAVQGYRGIDR